MTGRQNRAVLGARDGLAAAFFVPVLIMFLICFHRGIFPFGEETFLRSDMYHQYAPFFSEFRHKLVEGHSLLYSWDIGMGVNFWALFGYYLASPFNWLVAIVPEGFVLEFMTLLIIIKTGLAGLSMAFYLYKKEGKDSFGICYFGIFYALSGYMIAYNWNIMWLDCILLFPLLCFLLERLVRTGKGIAYSFLLGICIFSNYYISIMICMFLGVYFPLLLLLGEARGRRRALIAVFRFILYSLLGGALAAVVVLPCYYALNNTASGEFYFPKTVESYFAVLSMISRHMVNVESEIGLEHWPNIYCGVAVYLLVLLFILNGKISLRKRAVYVFLCLFFLLGFSVNVLNYIWHGFHYPNSLPARQSFIYIFLVLYMSYVAYIRLPKTGIRMLGTVFFGGFLFVFLAEEVVKEKHFHFSVFYVTALFLAVYGMLFYVYRKKRSYRGLVRICILMTVIVETLLNAAVTGIPTTSRTEYIKDNRDVRYLLSRVPDDTFYRVDKVHRKTKDDGAWLNFPSVSIFSSTAYADMSDFFKKIGNESSTNAYSITGQTPLFDMLFGVRYGLYSEEPSLPGLKVLDSSGGTYLAENPYILPLGYVLEDDWEANWVMTDSNPANVQNDLSNLLGFGDVLALQDESRFENSDESISYTLEESGEYFIFIGNSNVDKVTLHLDEIGYSKKFENLRRRYFIEAGYQNAGTRIRISNEGAGDTIPKIYRVDEFVLGEIYDKLSRQVFDPGAVKGNVIKGQMRMERPGLLMTSIPYDKGWQITVNGEKRTPRKYLNAFLALELNEGEQNIEMRYIPEGFIPGLSISLLALFMLLSLYSVSRSLQRKKVSVRRREAAMPEDEEQYESAKEQEHEFEIHKNAGTWQ